MGTTDDQKSFCHMSIDFFYLPEYTVIHGECRFACKT